MDIFYEYVQNRKNERKNRYNEYDVMKPKSVEKTMSTIRTYIRWLHDKGYVRDLTAADVTFRNVTVRYPKFLSEDELKGITNYLENAIVAANKKNDMRLIYTAYLWRALVRFLYTT